MSLSKYLVLKKKSNIYQNEIADNFVGINISVASVTLKLLEKKIL